VIGRLGIESWMAFKQVPRRGLEIGGILIGRTEIAEGVAHIYIEGFETVESEHRLGPSYLLSETDFSRLREAIGKKGAASLGIFRSQTRSEILELEPSDLELLDASRNTPGLFLLLGPVPGKAAFFTCIDGSVKCIHEFALASSLSSILALRQGRPAVAATPEPAKESAARLVAHHEAAEALVPDRVDPPQPVVQEKPRPRGQGPGWLIAAATAFLLLGAISGALAHSIYRPALREQPVPNNVLRLSVQPDASFLRLLWDPQSSAIQGAAHAVLHIQDGDRQADLDLSPAELSRGATAYEPRSTQVTFRLDLYPVEPNATGVIQVLNYPAVAVLPKAAPAAWQAPVKTASAISDQTGR
jgi:hypothetical protein